MSNFLLSNINSKLQNDYKGGRLLPPIQNHSNEDFAIDNSNDNESETYLNLLLDRFFDGDFSAISDIDQYVNQNDSTLIDSILIDFQDKYFAFIKALIESIQVTELDENSMDYISTSLHLLALLTDQKKSEFNDLLTEKFIQKLIFLVQQEYVGININSLWCISNLIWISEFSFDIFSRNKIFSLLSNLIVSEKEKIITLSALISQRALTAKNHFELYEINPIISILHELINYPLVIPKNIAIESISQIIRIKSNYLDEDTVQLYLKIASDNGLSDDIYLFGLSLSIISELLSTENPIVYKILKMDDQVIEILKKGINFTSEPSYQGYSIQSACFIIKYIPNLHENLIKYGIIEDMISIANEGDLFSKINVVEAFCRIFFNDDTPLFEEVLQNDGVEFLCDSLQYADEKNVIIEIIDAFNRIISKPEPIGSTCIEKLIDNELIEMLEDSIHSFEDSADDDQKIVDLISKEQFLLDFLIDYANENDSNVI